METIRSETLKYCIGFTLLAGVILVYAGIWSVSTGLKANLLIISTMNASLWWACGFILGGALLSAYLNPRSTLAASWVLCLALSAAIFVVLFEYASPYGAVGFLLPILFAVILFTWKQMALFTSLVLAASACIGTNFFRETIFQSDVLAPLVLIIALSILFQLIINEFSSNFRWYQQKYLTALHNEQIIRDNEVKLQRLIASLNDYEKYLTNTNNQLIRAREEAVRARNVKQIFVQNVSHELRTPLNLIIGFSEAMVNAPESYGEVNWTPDLKGDIDCIYQNSKHLKALIDDVLDLAALESNKYEIAPEDVDLNAIIREVTLVTTSPYNLKGLYLETDLEENILMVHADAVRIKQVLLNLLSNALKYTSEGGVVISAWREEEKARVTVEDSGKGIPKDDLEKVFEAFYQVDKASNREDSGTGLGLSISRQLIELHGGEMDISSRVGRGTTVSFTLPLAG